MNSDSLTRLQNKRRQGGVSIIAAIFLLLLFAAIAAFMVSMTSTANVTSAQDVQGARAYQAAQAGAEWGLFQLDPNGAAAALPGCFAAATPAIPGFTVNVVCTVFPNAAPAPNCTAPSPIAEFCYQEAGRQVRVYRIVATAAVAGIPAGSPAAVEREVRVTVERCRDAAIVAAPFDC